VVRSSSGPPPRPRRGPAPRGSAPPPSPRPPPITTNSPGTSYPPSAVRNASIDSRYSAWQASRVSPSKREYASATGPPEKDAVSASSGEA
jgi:hypothetical protein